ncbi:MAG: alpha/beta hydrolase [Leucobacter sp.]
MNDTSPSSRVESLDPVLAAMLPRMNAASPPINLGAPSLRDAYREMLARLRPGAEPFTGRIIDGTVVAAGADVPIRTWIPEGASEHGDCVIYLHGGGWVMGDRESAAPAARALAERMKLRVVVVDYRLAPEHPFPAAFDDCLAVFRAERRRTNGWLGIAGDSAGANLGAAVAITARDLDERLDAQLLFYPALDPTMSTDSHHLYAEGYLLTGEATRFYWESYIGGERTAPIARDWRLAPSTVESLNGVAPAVVSTAGYDPLRDEGNEYAARLAAAGVPTLFLPQAGLAHGWVNQTYQIPSAKRALAEMIEAFQLLRERAGALQKAPVR